MSASDQRNPAHGSHGSSCEFTGPDARLTHEAPAMPYLSPQQAAGLACVVCATPYDVSPPIPHVPVGTAAPGDGGGQVFACEASCAPAIGYTPPAQLEIGADR